MSKTQITLDLEKSIYKATKKQGLFAVFECTIGWFGKERVDYLTYDTNEIWRCYEIKSSKSDFYSKSAHTFVGHYNYFVMPKEVYEEVKQDIPKDIGVYCSRYVVKKAKKCKLLIDEDILKNSMIRSLYRDADKYIKSGDPAEIKNLKIKINNLNSEIRTLKNDNIFLKKELTERMKCDRLGVRFGRDKFDGLE